MTPHTFRHSYATQLLNDGFTIREVQTLLGHSNVSTTQIYTQVEPRALAEKIQRRTGNDETDRLVQELATKLEELPAETREALAEVLLTPS